MSNPKRRFRIVPANEKSQVIIQEASGQQQSLSENQPSPEQNSLNYQAGYDQGYQDATAEMQAQFANLNQHLEGFCHNLQQVHEQYLADLEHTAAEEVAALAMKLVETLLKHPSNQGDLLKSAVQEVLALNLRDKDLTLHANPNDCTFFNSGEINLPPNFTVHPDPKVAPGELQLHSSRGLIDASLDGRLETLSDYLNKQILDAEHE